MGLLHPDQLKDLAAARPAVPAETSRWNLGYLDSLVESHFRRLQDGTLNFYPYGPFGRRGFVVQSPEQEGV